MFSKEEIINLENQYWQAMKDKDVETAISLTHFPCIVTGSDGTRFVSEEDFRKMFTAQDSQDFQDVRLEETRVEFIGNESAIISYETHFKGKKLNDVSTWVRRGEDWVCAAHTETPIQ